MHGPPPPGQAWPRLLQLTPLPWQVPAGTHICPMGHWAPPPPPMGPMITKLPRLQDWASTAGPAGAAHTVCGLQ
jgi:hypothetical protein